MASESANQSMDIFFKNLNGYLSDDIDEADKSAIDSALGSEKERVIEHVNEVKGNLQLKIKELKVSEKLVHKIRTFVEDEAVSETAEAVDIDKFERSNSLNKIKRQLIFAAAVIAVLLYLTYNFYPRSGEKFDAMKFLHYEALTMETSPEGRLDFPTEDYEEVKEYFSKNKGLGFIADVFNEVPMGWTTVGASVIDYEIAKVSVVQFQRTEGDYTDSLFHFSYAGSVDDLPRAEVAQIEHINYRAFTTEELNIIAWESGENRVSILIGRVGAAEMANIAAVHTGG